uniref:Uncharacterized protein n=1 Tax=Aegilops tauschii subsp. strangulata TaxID=200361 RepID=A0A452ZM57_AEGTS
MHACVMIQELLPVHAPHMQREEAGAAAGQGHEHRGDHVRGRPQPPLREAHGGTQPHPQAASVPLAALTKQPSACGGTRTRVRT